MEVWPAVKKNLGELPMPLASASGALRRFCNHITLVISSFTVVVLGFCHPAHQALGSENSGGTTRLPSPDGNAPSARAANLQKLYSDSVGSVVTLFSDGGLCAGSVVAPDVVLTAWHCVWGLRAASVGFFDPKTPRVEAQTFAFDEDSDLALLHLSKPVNVKILEVVEAKNAPVVGDSVVVIGHPRAISLNSPGFVSSATSFVMTHGIVSRVSANELVSDAPADHGNSGGPILDSAGKLVGVTSLRSPSLTLSSSPERIRNFVQTNLPRKSDATLSFTNAHGDSVLNLVYVSDAYLRKESGNNAPAWGLELGYDFWDRVRFSYTQTFLRPERVQSLTLGVLKKFEFGAFSSLDLVAGGGWQNYRIQNGNRGAAKIYAGMQVFDLFLFTGECVFVKGSALPAFRVSL